MSGGTCAARHTIDTSSAAPVTEKNFPCVAHVGTGVVAASLQTANEPDTLENFNR
jgi:hypothetical protein